MGTKNVDETTESCAAYTLAPIADRIRQDVLILAGTEDHFVPIFQTADFEKALVNAGSVTTRLFDRPSGGAGHCQGGALTLYHAAVFDWHLEKFPDTQRINHTSDFRDARLACCSSTAINSRYEIFHPKDEKAECKKATAQGMVSPMPTFRKLASTRGSATKLWKHTEGQIEGMLAELHKCLQIEPSLHAIDLSPRRDQASRALL